MVLEFPGQLYLFLAERLEGRKQTRKAAPTRHSTSVRATLSVRQTETSRPRLLIENVGAGTALSVYFQV
ncbi:MAG: hypothetical protein H8E37_05865 [Planctomycetes bacterium]|nr:hypothetical protein [Planctomycetota bacterium]